MVFGLTEMLVMKYSKYDNLDKTYRLLSRNDDPEKRRSLMIVASWKNFSPAKQASPTIESITK